jgi:hypothetical protein
VDNCQDAHYGKGLCRKHWMRQRRTGTTADGPGRGQSAELLASVRPSARATTCGHPDRRHRAHGLCDACYLVQWVKDHPDANTGNTWARNNPEQHRLLKRKNTLKKRGFTPEEYDRLWTEQGGKCANPACDFTAPMVVPDYRQGLQADHDHKTERPRGLLCPSCNRAAGCINDDLERLAGLIEYLTTHNAVQPGLAN